MKSVTKTVFKVGDFVAWAQNEQLDLSPGFQRRAVWRPGAKSYLIDTIIRGLPIPIVFLRDKLSLHNSLVSVREVVDGQQRLRTILSFIDPALVSNYTPSDAFKILKAHNAPLANKRFADLSLEIRQAILGYEIPVHIFSSDTDDRDVLQIFARLNATGVRLNDQELRNAEYFGAFKTTAYTLAYENLYRWKDWGIFGDSDIARMTEVEEVSDLLVSMHIGVHAKNKAVLNKFYEDYDETYPVADEVKRRFEVIMSGIESTLGQTLKSTEFHRRALFNDLFVATYHLMFEVGSSLETSRKPKKLPKDFKSTLHVLSADLAEENVDDDVLKSLRGATAHFGTRLARINFILEPFGHELTEG
ncbi:DUF262 domain-containing protein [Pseudoxanthomonas sp. PXM03]|uniref:DUF262 domain-containing protein n=1 Tax=Pseudoxanthomonas sp. PXM03 TaxID=2769284 RepID=UPI00177F13C5|nr:DUF262 domain-containing protein [Pseudoxanthomonas sp. PXM03]MBD9435940.1 DUF262 domain-containing protein [Pseudoxanthomonas sp. PXM03]